MDLNFLPKLPKANLDDRTYQDLVEECLLRIPRYCPEWTNYNPSDPGVTLVELFAWLTDQMLYRFNQVPRRNYVTFLEMLGIRLRPPQPAHTDVTFYLSASLSEPYTIAQGVEVATLRTDSEEAIVFSTDRPLTVGTPSIRHLLTADTPEERPQILRDRLSGLWTLRPDGEWAGLNLAFFNEQPQEGNCFYLVFDPEALISGNVIAVKFKGEAATSTGINPEMPPRKWEAWNGQTWEPVLLKETDDQTQGFSFNEITRNGGNPLQGAEVVFHCPKQWTVETFSRYRGRWLRCIYTRTSINQPGYSQSPRIVGMSSRSLGGTVAATQATQITNEILGESDGTPGQTFQLQSFPILPRTDPEYLLVTPPGGLPQVWQEVENFADSRANDLHYTLDSITGEIQLGPLVREPQQLQTQTQQLSRQDFSRGGQLATQPENTATEHLDHQHGAVPPRGASLMMMAYRTGGGIQGNVQAGSIRIVKSAVPYVAKVINYQQARDGADGESLDAAVLRVPKILRTRDRAVTPEDFETLAIQGGQGAIARARCLPSTRKEEAGKVNLVLVPQADSRGIQRGEGIDPELFSLSPILVDQVLSFLDKRRLLGVEIQCQEPEYVGVAVQSEVALEPEYKNPAAQQEILHKLHVALYGFLNPITGGPDGTGWPFGRPVYASDIVTLFQAVKGVRYLGTLQLFELRYQNNTWIRTLPQEPVIQPGTLGLICSWHNDQIRSSHVINLI